MTLSPSSLKDLEEVRAETRSRRWIELLRVVSAAGQLGIDLSQPSGPLKAAA